MGDLLRIITQPAEAVQELHRFSTRYPASLNLAQLSRVSALMDAVYREGDRAFPNPPLKLSGSELDAAYQQISQGLLQAIRRASQALDQFYQGQLTKAKVRFPEAGGVMAQRTYPVQRAAIYLSPTTGALGQLLRQARAAKVANVKELVLVLAHPAAQAAPPEILVAAQEAGIEEMYYLAGPLAIAALAVGTQTIAKVEVITGPGDADVGLAKQLVSPWVKTDQPLTQTDTVWLVDHSITSADLAEALIDQLEQDPTAAQIVLTAELDMALGLQQEIRRYRDSQSLSLAVEKALVHWGLMIVLDEAEWPSLLNVFSPYALHVALTDPWPVVEKVQRVRRLILHSSVPLAWGDYQGASPLLRGQGLASHFDLSVFLQSSLVLEASPLAYQQDLADFQQLWDNDRQR
ncbi:histidinol dehydrogenase [Synechocystis sp. LKSZ1]|uniref:histidinol dehydrogenase n=1 Tax=Synechocystis sp. LKSZ1 TaxID=3144951 RepID=UPI00336BBE93